MRNESDWAYLPQSEERVEAQQIKQRSRQDVTYQAKTGTGGLLESAGGFGLSESVLCTYIDLDRQIEACAFSPEQQHILLSLMDGYSLRDIAELQELDLRDVERSFRNAVYAIVQQNNHNWLRSYSRKAT